MKNHVDNRFDNIGIVIENSEKDIDINIMNTNSKIPKSILLSTLSYTKLSSHEWENHNTSKVKNEQNIEWKKIDNKNPLDDNITLTESLFNNTLQVSTTLFNISFAIYVTLIISSIISRHKSEVLED